jgi:RHS repeat-associated protein
MSFSLPNIHGDVMATTDASGAQTGTFQYDPFGNVIGSSVANNTGTGTSFGMEGQHQKLTESALVETPVQMGARVYFPGLGRFASVDSVQGGNANPYIYPADPVSKNDLTGKCFGPFIEFLPLCISALTAVLDYYGGGGGAAEGRMAAKVLKNNNILRVGEHAGAFRIAAGPAKQYYGGGRIGSKIPIHIHVEWGKVLYQNHVKQMSRGFGRNYRPGY